MDIDAPAVVWAHDGVICTSQTFRPERVQITLTMHGVIIERESFPDAITAADFAIVRMHAYEQP